MIILIILIQIIRADEHFLSSKQNIALRGAPEESNVIICLVSSYVFS